MKTIYSPWIGVKINVSQIVRFYKCVYVYNGMVRSSRKFGFNTKIVDTYIPALIYCRKKLWSILGRMCMIFSMVFRSL